MTLLEIAKRLERLATDNSPAILTAVGVAGTVTTAVLSGKAAIKATRIIDAEREARSFQELGVIPLDAREKARLTWTVYLPPILSGGLTIGCIICASHIGTRRAAAMAAAYSLSEKAFTEYREKIVDRMGERKEQVIRDDIAQDRITRTPPPSTMVVLGGEVLCFDSLTGRYFTCRYESLRKAENDINFQLNYYTVASLTEFYVMIGLERTDISDELGWNLDNPLALEFSAAISDDGRPAIVITYKTVPIRDTGFQKVSTRVQ